MSLAVVAAMALLTAALSMRGTAALRQDALATELHDDFDRTDLAGWQVREGKWNVRDGHAVADGGFSILLNMGAEYRDCQVSAEVAYSHNKAHAATGIVVRFKDDGTGYFVCLRDMEKGSHPRLGPWERPVLQLFRRDRDGFKLLQESKVMGCRSDLRRCVKVVCRGPNIWVYYENMETPVLREYDAEYDRAGRVGLMKDHMGVGLYDNVRVIPIAADPAVPALRQDWSWVRGAVYVRSNAVNSVEMWHDYWEHTAVIDRELSYAKAYGFNMVQVYLHWIVWDRHKEEYLRRIDDFLSMASRYGLKANLILWDDCGHVEPSLSFAAPAPGRHNSQMMPNPSHRIRESEAEMAAHKERFGEYVRGVVERFKEDRRIAFWQLYNEAMGDKERYRVGQADANINRLLGWTRSWVKGTGTAIPVTATGGGFYGPEYSDFYTYHSYKAGKSPLPNADGGSEHLCTETLNRPDGDLVECMKGLAAKRNGFVVWELMIGRDNCRFAWGHPDGPDEPHIPFHGVAYPDGHPWDVREVEAMLGERAFASLQRRVFEVEYFDGEFKTSRKKSITPRIDFDLGDEPGTGSPDASAGIGKDDFSIRWTGRLTAPAAGGYTIWGDCDGLLRLWVGEELVLNKPDFRRREVRGQVELREGVIYPVRVEYVHGDGYARTHIYWNGPGFEKRVLLLNDQ